MSSVVRASPIRLLLAALLVLSLGLTACSGGGDGGAPRAPGQYEVQKNSVRYDGSRYQLMWSDKDGSIHQMQARNLKMVRDEERTYLEVPNGGGDPVLHLRQDEPVTVEGRDRQGEYSSPWFPFLLGAALGNSFGNRGGGGTVVINQPAPGEPRSYDPRTPAYRYPPTDSFGRGEELHGTVDSSRPQPPDYRRVAPAPYATSGQSAGTGGGTAATNKSPGSSSTTSGAGNGSATSGFSGGTGSGTAASGKGGFKSGGQPSGGAAGSGVGAGGSGALHGGGSSGSLGGLPSGGGGKGIGGSGSGGGGKGIGGARSGGGGRR